MPILKRTGGSPRCRSVNTGPKPASFNPRSCARNSAKHPRRCFSRKAMSTKTPRRPKPASRAKAPASSIRAFANPDRAHVRTAHGRFRRRRRRARHGDRHGGGDAGADGTGQGRRPYRFIASPVRLVPFTSSRSCCRALACHRHWSTAPTSINGDRPYFADTLATGGFVVGMPQFDAVSSRPAIPLALPLRNANGETLLIGIVTLDLDGLTQTLAASRLPPAGSPSSSTASARSWRGCRRGHDRGGGAGAGPAGGRDGVRRRRPGPAPNPPMGRRASGRSPIFFPIRVFYVAIGVPVSTIVAGGRIGPAPRHRHPRPRVRRRRPQRLARWRRTPSTGRSIASRPRRPRSCRGDLKTRAHLAGGAPELRRLAYSFNDMAASIERNDEELQQRNARLNQLIDDEGDAAAGDESPHQELAPARFVDDRPPARQRHRCRRSLQPHDSAGARGDGRQGPRTALRRRAARPRRRLACSCLSSAAT